VKRMNGVPSRDDVNTLLRSFSRAPTSVRNRALVTVMYRAGLRVSEALALEQRDLYPKEGEIRVRHAKGDKERITAMDDGAWAVLQTWLDKRKSLRLPRTAPIFCTLAGDPMSRQYVGAMLHRKADQLDIPRDRMHPHALRHAFAVELNREGKSTADIQCLLGHTSLDYTATYLSRRSPKEAIASARNRDWQLV
jgi:site-specific recombinase XerD